VTSAGRASSRGTPDDSEIPDTVESMQGNEQRRGGLRRRIAERWTPLFPDKTEPAMLTLEEFTAACDWDRLVTAGVVAPHEEPLGLAGLRLSTIFPRHLLRRRDDGRLVPITLDDAVALVRLTLAQEGRTATGASVLDDTDAVTHAITIERVERAAPDEAFDAAAGDSSAEDVEDTTIVEVPADAGGHAPGDANGDQRSRRRFFRRRD